MKRSESRTDSASLPKGPVHRRGEMRPCVGVLADAGSRKTMMHPMKFRVDPVYVPRGCDAPRKICIVRSVVLAWTGRGKP